MRRLRVICLLPLLLGLNSCTYLMNKAAMSGMFDKQLKKTNRTGKAKLIGTIEMVNPEQNYVLINCTERLNIPAGTEIVAQGSDGSKSTLKVTPERKGNYITADIKDGEPKVQDLVLYRFQPGDLPPPGTLPGATPDFPPEGPSVHLTPIMPADVIPPLGTPFQPMGETPQPPVLPTLPPPPSVAPAPAAPIPIEEPPAEPSKLPPVIR
ncbi:MAG: hypothetical protein R3F13_03910 [Prosthecobacter sp.]